jgi:hypothetical protein
MNKTSNSKRQSGNTSYRISEASPLIHLVNKVYVEILNGESFKKVPNYYITNPYLNIPITDIIGLSQTVINKI